MKKRLYSAASALLLVPSVVSASTVFSDSSSFLATINAGYYTEAFPSTPDDPMNFSGGDFSYEIRETPTVGDSFVPSHGRDYVSVSSSADSITINFTSGNVTAVGGNFYKVNKFGSFLSIPLTVNLSDGTSYSYTPTSITDFRGFVSNGPVITSLTLPAGDDDGGHVSLDNFTVGAVTIVPEMSSSALVACAIGLLGLSRRRQRA